MMSGTQFTQWWSLNTRCHRNTKQYVLQPIWFALLAKAIDNAIKDYRKQLQACVLAKYRKKFGVGATFWLTLYTEYIQL